MKTIDYTRGNPAGRAKRCEWLMKRIWKRVRALELESEGQKLAQKIKIRGKVVRLERHCPRLKALWHCYMWLAEDATKKGT